MAKLPLLVITGATATGKSELAVRVAERVGGEILSADSAQVYRRLDLGTAKPLPADRQRVRHHLINLIEPDQRFSVAEFQRRADAVAAAVAGRGRLPILVGGTGLYIRAVVQRFHFEPLEPDRELRRRLYERSRREGSEALHEELRRVDPASAARVHPRDARRIIRALEVYQLTGRPLSELQHARPEQSPYDALVVRLEVGRAQLYRRIDRRTNQQIASGWPEEVRALLREFPPDAPGLQILGYRELVHYARGEAGLDATIRLIKRNTRRYARRQLTWWRRETADLIIDATGGIREETVRDLTRTLRNRWQGLLADRRKGDPSGNR